MVKREFISVGGIVELSEKFAGDSDQSNTWALNLSLLDVLKGVCLSFGIRNCTVGKKKEHFGKPNNCYNIPLLSQYRSWPLGSCILGSCCYNFTIVKVIYNALAIQSVHGVSSISPRSVIFAFSRKLQQ